MGSNHIRVSIVAQYLHGSYHGPHPVQHEMREHSHYPRGDFCKATLIYFQLT
jgi:hypothetical protein